MSDGMVGAAGHPFCFEEREEQIMEHVELKNRKLVHRGSILDIYQDEMLLPNGKTENWDYVEHRKGAAAVVPVLPDGRILMVSQYRHALGRMTLEIPAGSRDSVTEDMALCAARELEEETGYRAQKMEQLLSLRTTVAFCNERIDVFLARDLVPGEQHLDEAEDISVQPWELEELVARIYRGEIQDGKTVSAILAYQVKLLREMQS